MKYLEKFVLPSFASEATYLYPTKYPFSLFSSRDLYELYFSDITIFYGGNGSGKSTLLNVINSKLGFERKSSFFMDEAFEEYVNRCKFSLNFDEDGKQVDLPKNSKIIASEDVFNHILKIRERNIKNEENRKDLREEYFSLRDNKIKFKSLDDYDKIVKQNDTRRQTQTDFVRSRTSFIKQFSNGESALKFFDSELESEGLYLLDEPENSLSPEFQIQLLKLIVECSRYCDCQFIIATHSPFLLSIPGAKIYNLDTNPVDVCKWTDLDNVRIYYDFFMKHKDEFDE